MLSVADESLHRSLTRLRKYERYLTYTIGYVRAKESRKGRMGDA